MRSSIIELTKTDRIPELLAPAGQWESLVAAVQNGADAVYLGGKTLNARRGAGNFDAEELIRASDYLHERGKKVYVTVNTVVKQSELAELERLVRDLAASRADAAIVQDFGVAEVLRAELPSLKLHASTQMAIHNVQGVRYIKNRGFDRVVPARELSLEEIRESAQQGIEIEVFCHGALCVACSGQCLFSSLVGGRSGNRGACAQPCRLPYRLQGARNAEGYLLSPKDLMTAGYLKELCGCGVSSLKIEGRLKRPEYVATVVRIYRKILDGDRFTAADEEELKQIFNRGGFTEGYAKGIRDGEFLSVRRPSHMGVKVARAVSAGQIVLEKDVLEQDALVLRPERGEEIPLKMDGLSGRSIKNPTGRIGDIFRMNSAQQLRTAQESCEGEHCTVDVRAGMKLRIGEPAELTVTDGIHCCRVQGETVQAASGAGLNPVRIRQQLEKSGGTVYRVNAADIEFEPGCYLPVSALNALRRQCLQELSDLRIRSAETTKNEVNGYSLPVIPEHSRTVPRIAVQSSSVGVLYAAMAAGARDAVYFPTDLRAEALRNTDLSGLYLYLPPVMPTNTLTELNRYALEQAEKLKGVYITNISQLDLEWPGEKRYDFTLNTASAPCLEFLKIDEHTVYTPSCELTVREIREFGGTRELLVYGALPLMHLRHCPLNAARGGGKHVQCRACDTAAEGKRLSDCSFTDRMNVTFPLRRLATDDGCIIDLMNSVPLNLAGHIDQLPDCDGWRLIFDGESPQEAARITKGFVKLAEGGRCDDSLTGMAFTTGHYFRKTE